VTEIAPDAGFIEIGLDSIAAVSLANDIAREFGRTVPVVRILSCDSLAALAVEVCEGARRGPTAIASTARAMPG
jgi:acyl carrier protein